jgi:hypothetical protein
VSPPLQLQLVVIDLSSLSDLLLVHTLVCPGQEADYFSMNSL